MSVGQNDSHKHFNFLQSEHNRQQEQLNRNIFDRLNALESTKIKSYSTQKKNLNTDGTDLKEKLQAIVNSNVQNMRRLERSTRQNYEEMFEKMRSMEAKMMRMLRDKEEAMEYLDLRLGSLENGQKAVNEMMKRMMNSQGEKYSGLSLLEDRMKQVEYKFELRDQRLSEQIKLIDEEVNLKIENRATELQKIIESLIESQKSLKEEPAREDWQVGRNEMMQECGETMRTMQMELKENKRKIVIAEEKVRKLEEGHQDVEGKIGRILRDLDALRHQKICSSGRSQRVKMDVESNEDEGNKPHFRDLSSIRGAKGFSKEPSESEGDEDPFVQAQMRGGIRGLLQKSKQKEEKPNSRSKPKTSTFAQSRGLPRQQGLAPVNPLTRRSQKGLPPVRADPKMMNQQMNLASEQSEEEQMFGVDEQGFLVNENGSYIYNEYEERIQLSAEQFEELMRQQSG